MSRKINKIEKLVKVDLKAAFDQ